MAKKILPRDVNMAKKLIVITNEALKKEEQMRYKIKIEKSEKEIPFIISEIIARAKIGYNHYDIYMKENVDKNYIKNRLYHDYGFSFDDANNSSNPIRVCWVSPQKKLDIGVLAG